ncbi:MAG: hypothetical protein AAF658_10125, partial [Myxococcota bacterium]
LDDTCVEQVDDEFRPNTGNQCPGGACNDGVCQPTVCGDGFVDRINGETCDDGDDNNAGEGFCVADCSAEQVCGDGVTNGTETCDDGDATSNGEGSCVADCSATQVCGNAAVEGTEACDDGNTVDNGELGCVADCSAVQTCGDGITNGDEGCDAGSSLNGTSDGLCAADCTAVRTCGNGVLETGEACDDGNLALEVCDYGATSCTVCNATCQPVAGLTSFCGDGSPDVANAEECDDANAVNFDACSNSCRDAGQTLDWQYRSFLMPNSNEDPACSQRDLPGDLAVAADGTVYLLESENDEVHRLESERATGLAATWVRGVECFDFARCLSDEPSTLGSIDAITVTADQGLLSVGRRNGGLWFVAFDPRSGNYLDESWPRELGSGSPMPFFMETADNGDVVVVGRKGGELWMLRRAPDFGPLSPWGDEGLTFEAGTPGSLALRDDGLALVSLGDNRTVTAIASDGSRPWGQSVSLGAGRIDGTAIGPDGSLWVSGSANSDGWFAELSAADGQIVREYSFHYDPLCLMPADCTERFLSIAIDSAGDVTVGGDIHRWEDFWSTPTAVTYAWIGKFTANASTFDEVWGLRLLADDALINPGDDFLMVGDANNLDRNAVVELRLDSDDHVITAGDVHFDCNSSEQTDVWVQKFSP